MQKIPVVIILVVFIALFAACSLSDETTPETVAPIVAEVAAPTSAHTSPVQTPTPHPPTPAATGSAPVVEPDIPAIVDELYFGVPAGNGDRPRRVAIDGQRRRLYSLNEGLASDGEGNTISIIDLETGQIAALLRLNNMAEQDFFPPTPLDLQVDPYRPRLYALSGDPTTLTVIDTDSLAIIDVLPAVEAIAPGPDRLYLANDTRLWAVDPLSLAELAGRELDPRQFNEPLRLNAGTNRLYLGRGRPWSLEVFAAGSLAPIGRYPIADELLGAVVDQANERLLILDSDGAQVTLRALDNDGQPLAGPPPVPITDNVYRDVPLALTEQSLYLVDDDNGSYRLQAIALPGLTVKDSLPLPTLPHDLVVDPATGLLYAAYSNPGSYVLALDPATGSTEAIRTALEIIDALADPATGRLYVLDDRGALRLLDLSDYHEIARLETGLDMLNGRNHRLAQLSLDPGRNRLYLGGDPVRTVDTGSFQVTIYPDARGQITPDPTGDRLYLTPPCQCRLEQCNTLVLAAGTLTGTETLFPPEDPLSAPCVLATSLDHENQLLYVRIDNGVAGSNSGNYFAVFDARPPGPPAQIYTAFEISFGQIAFDPPRRRAFVPRRRHDRSFIHRFEAQGQTISQTLELAGAQGQLVYDPQYDRLYAVGDTALQLFDGDLTLLAETSLPGQFDLLTFDPQSQRLYLRGSGGQMLIVATGGGQLEPPPPVLATTGQFQPRQLFVAPGGAHFRIDSGRLYRSYDSGRSWQLLGEGLPGRPANALAISPNYEVDRSLLVGLLYFGRGAASTAPPTAAIPGGPPPVA